MANLPTPGGDSGVWGTILNEYLEVAHQPDGTQNAEDVVNVPTAPITSTNVQDAIDELAGITATPGFYPTTTVSADHNATDTDQVILVDASGGTKTVFLPTPVGRTGKVYTVRKIDTSFNAARVNVAAGTPLIDGIDYGLNRYELKIQWEAITVVSDGTNWHRLDEWTKNPSGQNPVNVGQIGNAYVSGNYGNDLYSGLTQSQAKRTIGAALALPTVSTIFVDRGTYTETLDMSAKIGIIIQGRGYGGTTITPPSSAADAVILGVGCVIRDLKIDASSVTDYTGTLLKIDAGGTQNIVENVVLIGHITLDATGQTGGPDPVYGGTGIFVRNTELNTFRNVVISDCHTGIDLADIVDGCSGNRWLQCQFVQCWKEISMSDGPIGAFHFEDFKSSGAGYSIGKEWGFCWDITNSSVVGGQSIFMNCDFSETFTPHKSRVNSERNTFINCHTSPQCSFYITGDNNKFIDSRCQKEWFVEGNCNSFDGFDKTGGGLIWNSGANNRFDRFWNAANAQDQIVIQDSGVGTFIDGQRRAYAPPGWGYGFRKGDIIWNLDYPTSGPSGWVCTVQALGTPEPQAGTWVNLDTGAAVAKSGTTRSSTIPTVTATGAVS